MAMTNTHTPILRFPEFSDPWKAALLGDVATFAKGKGISKADISEDGRTPCIRYGELYTDYGTSIDQTISYTNVSPSELHLSEGNEVIVPASGEDAKDIATAAVVLRKGIALGGDLNVIRSKQDGLFLASYLSGKKRMTLASMAQGHSVVHLYPTQLQALEFALPPLPEQKKIAASLASVDTKISQLERKKTLLEGYKNGCMQQLFSQEVRFKADDGSQFPDWEVRKLGDLGPVAMCKRVMKDETKPIGDVPFYKIGTFGREPDAFIDRELFDRYREKYSFPKLGDILISAAGTIGRLAVYDGSPAYFQDSNIVWVANDEIKVENNFLYYCYQNVRWTTEDTTIARLYNDNLRNIDITAPTLPEQRKIADFLSAIDRKIELVTIELEKAKAFKKGLLQQMFV